jgi:hypothetical protein
MSSTNEERKALDLLQSVNRRMAERAEAPGWYHVTLGLLVGGLVAVQEAPVLWRFIYFVPYGIGLLLLVRAYKRHTGLWIPGYRAGRTRWVAMGGALLTVALMLLAGWANLEGHLQGAYLVSGVLVAAVVTATGYIWHWAYRRDLGAT